MNMESLKQSIDSEITVNNDHLYPKMNPFVKGAVFTVTGFSTMNVSKRCITIVDTTIGQLSLENFLKKTVVNTPDNFTVKPRIVEISSRKPTSSFLGKGLQSCIDKTFEIL